MAKPSDIKELLQEEMENKKPFDAKWDGDCYFGCSIMEGDEFFFYGSKKKVCGNCHREMIDFVENA